ncbi:MAG TPA: hypothetical protein VNW24_05785 [Stellaceae bacterium]|nr:hypothetical protein [Stellaceae bacterium]
MAAKSAAIAKAGAARPRRRTARRSVTPTLAILAALLLTATELPLAILLLAGLVPSMVAALIDRTRARYLTRAVGFMNLAGLSPLVMQLWGRGLTMIGLADILSRPVNWLIMYGAAAIGWVLFLGMPSLARIFVDIRADQLQQDLKARAARLVQDWGDDVTGKDKTAGV